MDGIEQNEIERELPISLKLIGPLDLAFFKPSSDDWAFLRAAISEDDDEIRRKVLAAQSQTYEIVRSAKYPYPCIRFLTFTNLVMSTNPAYASVIKEGRENPEALFLDLGCFMGTDVRKLVQDGFPASRIVGCDLRSEFIDAGYTLFGDRTTCSIAFFADDIFKLSLEPTSPQTKPSSDPLKDVTMLNDLQGRMAYIYTGALFHLFVEETQRALVWRLASLLCVPRGAVLGDAPVKGCVIFGKHQGRKPAGVIDTDDSGRYGHNPETWTGMWRSVFEERYGRTFTDEHLQVQAQFIAVTIGDEMHDFLLWSIRTI